MANPLVSNPGHILPMGYADMQDDVGVDGQYRPISGTAKGQYGAVRDEFGVRILRFMHNKIGAVTKAGGLYSRAADISIAAIDAGSTTLLIKKAAGFTANALVGRVMYYKTNATTAGAAPEGESAIIESNTAGALSLALNRPLSATPNSGDAIQVFSLFDFIASAANDLAVNVFGICLATNGISDGNWGVLQVYGFCPDVLVKAATAITAQTPVIADVEQVAPGSSPASKYWVGWAPEAVNNPNAKKSLIFINVYNVFGPAAAS